MPVCLVVFRRAFSVLCFNAWDKWSIKFKGVQQFDCCCCCCSPFRPPTTRGRQGCSYVGDTNCCLLYRDRGSIWGWRGIAEWMIYFKGNVAILTQKLKKVTPLTFGEYYLATIEKKDLKITERSILYICIF